MKNNIIKKLGIYIMSAALVASPVATSVVMTVPVYAADVETDTDEIATDTSVDNINSGVTVTTNNGTVTTNAGTINENRFTVTTNDGTIIINNGPVTTNNGTINNNNSGTVTTNVGTIGKNDGTVATNSSTGTIASNFGEVTSNAGTVNFNSGTITNNTGTVAENSGDGTVTNGTGGVVTVNRGTVNGGTVDTNLVNYDHSGGNVSGATVNHQKYEVIKVSEQATIVGFKDSSDRLITVPSVFVNEGDSITIFSYDNYVISALRALNHSGSSVGTLTKNANGSWTLSGINDAAQIIADLVKKEVEHTNHETEKKEEKKEESSSSSSSNNAAIEAEVARSNAFIREQVRLQNEATTGTVEYVARQTAITNSVAASMALFNNMTPSMKEVVKKTGIPVNAGASMQLSKSVVDAIRANKGVPYKLSFRTMGLNFDIMIPANFNFKSNGISLLNPDGSVNTFALATALGFTLVP